MLQSLAISAPPLSLRRQMAAVPPTLQLQRPRTPLPVLTTLPSMVLQVAFRQVTFRLTVQSQQRNFILSSSPSAVTIPAGNNTTSTITVSSIQGYNETVNLSCNAPSGTTCNLSTSSVTPPSNGNVTVTLSVQTTTSTPAGTYSITVSGVDIDNRLRQTTFTVTVAPPSFTMSVLPASATVTPGNGITATVTVTSVNSFSSEVSLSCPPINGVTCAFTPQKVTPPSNGSAVSTVSIQTSSTEPPS